MSETEPRIGYVYFIHAPSVNRIKIGYAGYDPNLRFTDLNVGSPVVLIRHSLMRAPRSMEGEIHLRFRKYHKKGEWFRTGAALMAYIAVNARGWMELLAEERAIRDRENGIHFAIEAELRHEAYRKIEQAEAEKVMKNGGFGAEFMTPFVDPKSAEVQAQTAQWAAKRKEAWAKIRKRRHRFGPLMEKIDQLEAQKARERDATG